MSIKRALLGTTALVAVGVAAGPTFAADPVSLAVGGYYRTSAVQIIDDDDGAGQGGNGFQDTFITQDVEVHFTGETTLDNGLTVGVNIQLEGETNGDQIDETWAYVSGSWGQLRIGQEDGVAYNFGYIGPYAGLNFSAFTPWFNMTTVGNTSGFAPGPGYNTNFSVHNLYDADSQRIYYTTPDFNGFQLGVSYAPDTSQDNVSPFVPLTTDNTSNIWDFALGYSGEFSGVTVGLSGGYSRYDVEISPAEPEAWSVAANFGSGPWSVGGSYQNADVDNAAGFIELELFEVGVAYASGPWLAALTYSNGDWGISGTGTNEDTLQTLVLAVGYVLGPGIHVDAGLGYSDLDNDTAGGFGPDADSISIGLGLGIDY